MAGAMGRGSDLPSIRSAMIPVLRACNVALVHLLLVWGSVGCSDPGYQGRSSNSWIDDLRGGTLDQRQDAAIALGRVLELQPNSRKVVQALTAALRDSADAVRTMAASSLRRAGPHATAAIPFLGELLDDCQHADVRVRALRAIGDVGRHAPNDAMPFLTRGLRDSVPEVQIAALGAVSGLGGSGRPAVARVGQLALTGRKPVKLAAVDALTSIGVGDTLAAMTLVTAIQDSDAEIRGAAAIGLARLDARDARTIAALIVATEDPSAPVRGGAVYALGRLSESLAIPALRRALADADSSVRKEAQHAMTGFHRDGGRDQRAEPSAEERCRTGAARRSDRC